MMDIELSDITCVCMRACVRACVHVCTHTPPTYLRVDNRVPLKVVQVRTVLLAAPLLIEIYRVYWWHCMLHPVRIRIPPIPMFSVLVALHAPPSEN